MIKRRGESQIGNLIPNCKSFESKGSNQVRLERVIHHWKGIFKGYKILSLHSQNEVDLKHI
jgi:hypothetical protein